MHLFFQYLGRKVINEVDLSKPLESVFYGYAKDVINKYWVEYEKILSHYVDEAAIIGNVHYDILLEASKDKAKHFKATKSKNNKRQFLDNELNVSENKELFAPNPKVSSRLKRYKFEASDKTMARVDKDINQILGEAYREGWGPRDVADKIKQRFTDLSTYEARRIAQTEINTTRNYVQYQRMQDDEMEYKIWHAAHDSRTRKSHLDVDEEIVPLNERFSNGLLYPGDKEGPISEWVNCRCSHAAYIMPLGYEAPDFFPFTESDLIKVGSSLSQDYVSEIQERIRLIDGAMVREQEETNIEKPSVVEPVVKPTSKKPKPVAEVSHPYSDIAEQNMDEFERKIKNHKKEHLQFFTDDGLVSPIKQGYTDRVSMSAAQEKWLEEQTKAGKKIHATHNHPTEYELGKNGEYTPTLLSDGDHSEFLKMNHSQGYNIVSHSAEGPDNRYTISKMDNFDDFTYAEQNKAMFCADAKVFGYVENVFKKSPKLKMLREIKSDLTEQGIDWRQKMREDPSWWEGIQKKVDAQIEKMRADEHAKTVEEMNKCLNKVGIKVESTPRKNRVRQ